ncbi:MAG: hypothetical protein ACFB9N_06335 [Geitlerinemataceae cyanobacterium]
MMLTLLSFAVGLTLSARAMKILFDRYMQERKYHTIDADVSAEDFLQGRV